jgi:hypothetical protein
LTGDCIDLSVGASVFCILQADIAAVTIAHTIALCIFTCPWGTSGYIPVSGLGEANGLTRRIVEKDKEINEELR